MDQLLSRFAMRLFTPVHFRTPVMSWQSAIVITTHWVSFRDPGAQWRQDLESQHTYGKKKLCTKYNRLSTAWRQC